MFYMSYFETLNRHDDNNVEQKDNCEGNDERQYCIHVNKDGDQIQAHRFMLTVVSHDFDGEERMTVEDQAEQGDHCRGDVGALFSAPFREME